MYGLRGLGGSCDPIVSSDASGNPIVTYPSGCTQTSLTISPSGAVTCDPTTNPFGCGTGIPASSSPIPGISNTTLMAVGAAFAFVVILALVTRR